MPRPRNRAVWLFALKVLAWLGPCLAAWYLLAPAHSRPVAWIAQDLVNGYTRGVVKALEWNGSLVTFVTDLPLRGGVVAIELNPLVYTYGTALYLALAFAGRLRISRILLGLAILVPFHAWGLAFEMLAEIGVKAPAEVGAAAGIAGLGRELVPLGYQLGSLMFPTLVPIVLWAAFGGLRGVAPQAFGPGEAGAEQDAA